MITSQQYQIFLSKLNEHLEGDWVVIGGSLLALINADSRTTADIDLCSIGELTNEKRISLMDLAVQSGLSVESINPAADFFLNQIPNWKNSIVLYKKGKKGSLYRPSLELYFELKLNRGTTTDIQDCLSFLNWHIKNQIDFDKSKIKTLLIRKKAQDKIKVD